MQLPEISIRRPVFATVLSLLIVLLGWVSFNRLTVREYPKIDNPVVTVETKYVGASSTVVESQVTKVLEDSLSGIEGVDVITSISRQEQSQITVKFLLTRDPDAAASDVRDKVSRVRQRLPVGIDEPVIAKVEADAQPVIWLSFSSDTMNTLQLTDLANRIAKPMMQTAPGVADVRIFGERKYAMRVWLDTDRLAAYRLTTQDIEDALRKSNVEVPAGRVESQMREFNITTATDLRKPEEFGDIVIRNVNGMAITSSTNRITDAIAGTTLELFSTTTGAANLDFSRDTSSVKTKIQALVTAFNDANSMLTVVSDPKSTVAEYGASLVGNNIVSTVRSQMRAMITTDSTSPSGGLAAFRDLGLSINRSGTLELNAAKLDSAMLTKFDNVVTLLTSNQEKLSATSALPAGAAGEAVKKLTSLLDATGAITSQSTNLTKKITDYQKELTALDTKMTALLTRYNKQFASMESIVGQSKSLQTSLKSTFEGMMSAYTNK